MAIDGRGELAMLTSFLDVFWPLGILAIELLGNWIGRGPPSDLWAPFGCAARGRFVQPCQPRPNIPERS
jgi:hypothetical protein